MLKPLYFPIIFTKFQKLNLLKLQLNLAEKRKKTESASKSDFAKSKENSNDDREEHLNWGLTDTELDWYQKIRKKQEICEVNIFEKF